MPAQPRQEVEMPEGSPVQGSPARRHYLVSQLKRLRAQTGLSQEEAAEEMGWHKSKVSRIENGKWKRLSSPEIDALCRFYKASDELREELAHIAKAASRNRASAWWNAYEDVPGGAYYPLEYEADQIFEYTLGLFSGLAQHPDYIRALMGRGAVPDEAERERRLEARLERSRSILYRDHPPRMWWVVDEPVLTCQVGGPRVMRAQLEHLLELSDHPSIDLQVLPQSEGMSLNYGFCLLWIGDDRVGHVDVPPQGLLFDASEDVQHHELRSHHLRAAALSPERSRDLVRDRIAELD
ncbi:helix-turn-helix domain-containing protein [Nocardiopsis dassonvillei]|uniref:helix-turn-helix domain-containing protein n=1 Tax=Nocardiopsis dassonvillei TaxID=2014 RepID=UPI0036717491